MSHFRVFLVALNCVILLETPLDQFVFRGWVILLISLVYDLFGTKERHYRKIGKAINGILIVFAMLISIVAVGIVLAPQNFHLNIGKNSQLIVSPSFRIDYNEAKWFVLVFPALMIIEENLLRKPKKQNRKPKKVSKEIGSGIVETAAVGSEK